MLMGKTTKAKKYQQIYPNSVILSISKRLKEEIKEENLIGLEKEYYKIHKQKDVEKDFFIRRVWQLYSDRKKKELGDELIYCKYLLQELPDNEVIIIDDIRRKIEVEYFMDNFKGEVNLIDLSLVYKNDLKEFKKLMDRVLGLYHPTQFLVLIKHNSEIENWDLQKVNRYFQGEYLEV
jgi:adenylate kinase family enzyme